MGLLYIAITSTLWYVFVQITLLIFFHKTCVRAERLLCILSIHWTTLIYIYITLPYITPIYMYHITLHCIFTSKYRIT